MGAVCGSHWPDAPLSTARSSPPGHSHIACGCPFSGVPLLRLEGKVKWQGRIGRGRPSPSARCVWLELRTIS